MEEGLVGVVCSKEKEEIYYLIGSNIYKKEYKREEDLDIINIEHCYLKELVSDWSYNKLIEISKP